MATDAATNKVYPFLKSLNMPGLRLCESDPAAKEVLLRKGFIKTPDLICGPNDLNDAPIEGFFFIEVNEPSGDFLFKEIASEKRGLKNNVSQVFRSLLGEGEKFEWGLNQLPTTHYSEYIEALNCKLKKYSFLRSKTTNTGIIHFFDLGESTKVSLETQKEDRVSFENQNKFFAMCDYLHFYTKLESSSENKVLDEALKYLLKELAAEQPKRPYLLLIPRDGTMPILFLMIHVITYRKGVRFDFGIMMVNTNIDEKSENKYPMHTWLIDLGLKSQLISTETECDGTMKIHVQRNKLPFE